MPMVTLIVVVAAGGFALAGAFVGLRAFARARRGSLERRRLASLGTADEHREYRR